MVMIGAFGDGAQLFETDYLQYISIHNIYKKIIVLSYLSYVEV
jgi:hypothetical protein